MSNKPKFFWGKHKRLWDILAQTGGDSKQEALKTMGETDFPVMRCYACSAKAESALYEEHECPLDCPLNWEEFSKGPCFEGGLYDEWAWANTKEKRKRIAALIRDLPLSPYARDLYEVIDG